LVFFLYPPQLEFEVPESRWPARLWIVRHGESAGNVARDRAYAAGALRIDIAERDMDVPLSARGVEQSQALAEWFARMPADEYPEAVLTSPYVRARQTAELICQGQDRFAAGRNVTLDERLREREFGILDRLTHAGIAKFFPDQSEARKRVGKFYHRPPGGESWCDVILRLRSVLDTLSLHYEGRRVLIVAHEVVVHCLRYLLEELDEAQIMEIDRQGDVVNCGVTEYRCDPHGKLQRVRWNFAAPLAEQGAPITAAPDKSGGPR
jgi:probable phosphoglycerate mutase